ncbi:unnamed protein product, partial [Porites evermanni]
MSEHGGTHIDAPKHFYQKGKHLNEVLLDELIGPAVVVDISVQTAKDQDYQLSVGDLEAWEEKHGKIPDGAILFLYSGRGKDWANPDKFLGYDPKLNKTGYGYLHSPGFSPEAAEWIVKSGKVSAVGVDVVSLDNGQSKIFKSHTILLSANISGYEMVANLDKLPPAGAMVYGAPIKIKDGTGGASRIFA